MPHRIFTAVAALVVAGAAATLATGHLAAAAERESTLIGQQIDEAHRLLLTLREGESAIRGTLAYDLPGLIDDLQRATDRLETPSSRRIIAVIDREHAGSGREPLERLIAQSVASRRSVAERLRAGDLEGIIAAGRGGTGMRRSGEARQDIESFIAARQERQETLSAAAARHRAAGSWLAAAAALGVLGVLAVAGRRSLRRARQDERDREVLRHRSGEIGALLAMNEMLQACERAPDVARVVAHAAGAVLSDSAGALWTFAPGRDALSRAACWGARDAAPAADEPLAATACWALKRGRPHVCGTAGELRCEHGCATAHGLCVPMAMKGEVFGILQVTAADRDTVERSRALATAIADGASLALANIALRERLVGRALRDPLTGLHNRRFLDATVERHAAEAGRRGAPIAVAMVDIDHFKRLNDTHGHATGDAVLRALGATLSATLRGTDIACRYGGEEFVLLLPECDLQQACARLEDVRRAVARMHEGRHAGLPPVSVSIGVATMPGCATTLAQAQRLADEALYAAKAAGRDRVLAAPRRRPEEEDARRALRVVEAAAAG